MATVNLIIVIGWVSFWLYWLISAVGVKRGTNSIRSRFMGIRLLIFVIALLILRSSLSLKNNLNSQFIGIHDSWMVGIGLLFFFLGLLLAIWARIYIGKNWGMPMSLKQDPELVTSGPYHFIRHPIYTGILLATLGSAMASSIYYLVVLIFFGIYFIYSATVEEKIMLKQFPGTYPSHKKHTKMLIPFVF